MKAFFVILQLTFGMWILMSDVRAQGCSDAGFCTIHSIKPSVNETSSAKNQFKTGMTYGVAQYQVTVLSPYLEYTRYMGNVALSTRLLLGMRLGELTTNTGLADAIITATWAASSELNFTAGVKVPFNNANKKIDGRPLPMAYQTSLGTTDMILGITRSWNKFSISGAWQQPLTQNGNTFLIDEYPDGILSDPYISTNGYKRKGDVLLRLSHSTQLSEKIIFSSSILPIYHFGDDSYENSEGEEITIDDSKGLTLNLNVFFQYHLTQNTFVELNLGGPVVAREKRPDGLSQFAIAAEYSIRF